MKSEILTHSAIDVHLHLIISLFLGVLSVNENEHNVENNEASDDEDQVECWDASSLLMNAELPILAYFWRILETSTHCAENVLRIEIAHVCSVVDDHGREEWWTVFHVVLFLLSEVVVIFLMKVFSVAIEALCVALLNVLLAQRCFLYGLFVTIISHFIVAHCMEFSDVVPKFILSTFIFQ